MPKSHRHTEKHAKKQPTMTPKERKRARQLKKQREQENVPLIPQ